MLEGCYTALITPMHGDAETVNFGALSKLVDFQIASGISGLLAAGTTGESPTLTWEEHEQVVCKVKEYSGDRCAVIAGTGSNCTLETLQATKHAVKMGLRSVLLVDPYYNGPSSLEIRREYVAPVARAFPETQIVLYVIPGRTGCQLLPEDIAILHREFPNVDTVKEATGDLANMRRLRACCGPTLSIVSGDDDKTFDMMVDPLIGASGVISVVSNVAPAAVQQMTAALRRGERRKAEALRDALAPLFKIVTVKTEEETPYGKVTCRARNPLGIKTLMNVLGMHAGPCRRPLGKMTAAGLERVLEAGRAVWRDNPEILKPIEQVYKVSVEERLNDPNAAKGLAYEGDPYAAS